MPKCQFAIYECIHLGHRVGRGQVRPDAAKTQSIKEFLRPKTKKDIRSFLGLAGYYRRFVPGYATTATPSSDLTCKDKPDKLQWEPIHQTAFDAHFPQTLSSKVQSMIVRSFFTRMPQT